MRRPLFLVAVMLLASCDRDAGNAPAPAAEPLRSGTSSSTPMSPSPPQPSGPTRDGLAVRPTESEATPGLRPSYVACLEAADAVVPAVQACIEAEGTHQQARLERALEAARQAKPGEAAALQYRQAAWQVDTDRRCAWDADTEGQQQRLEANMCSLEAVARRADELSR